MRSITISTSDDVLVEQLLSFLKGTTAPYTLQSTFNQKEPEPQQLNEFHCASCNPRSFRPNWVS